MLRGLDQMIGGEVRVSGGGSMPPVAEQLSDQGQVFAEHDGMAGHGMAEIVNPKRAEAGILAYSAPARPQAVVAALLRIAGKQEGVGPPRAGQFVENHLGGFAKGYGARPGLTVRQSDCASAGYHAI